jgi:hypothetical protein
MPNLADKGQTRGVLYFHKVEIAEEVSASSRSARGGSSSRLGGPWYDGSTVCHFISSTIQASGFNRIEPLANGSAKMVRGISYRSSKPAAISRSSLALLENASTR